MEEIKIYHSLWRMLLMGIGGLAFAVMIFLILRSPRPGNVIIGYIGIIFFGLGGLALIYWALKERLTGRPFLTITDEGIIYNGGWKQYEIRFADVNSFVLLGGRQNKFIGIRFKEGVERRKMEDANIIGRLARKFNLAVSGTQESISLSGVPMKPQELCDILNKRLKSAK
ncbi:MAG: hypothetical protein IKQ05_01480 [Prevotella sp.]|nr:hypothetical protein [Prevotella sp.]